MKMNHLFMAGALLLSSASMIGIASVVQADDNSVNTTGDVSFIENTDPIDPIDPVDPIDPIDPTSGPLSIDYASSFHFGKQKISAKDETYYAAFDKVKGTEAGETADKPNWVQVTDQRGTNAGWKLQVQQGTQLTTGKDESAKVLKGAEIKITNTIAKTTPDNKSAAPTAASTITLVPGDGEVAGAAQDVMVAQKDQGMATWLDVFGDEETGDKSIALSVPGTSEKVKDGKYTTELTWLLSDTPA